MNDMLHNYAINAQLSYAAYTDLEGVEPTNFDELVNRLTTNDFLNPPMSEAHALSFLGINRSGDGSLEINEETGFDVIHHLPNDSSGFSATVFRNRETSEYHFAVRGTEISNLQDIINDANAVLTGGADDQIVSMLNYYMRLIKPAGENAIQVSRFVDPDGNELFDTFTTEGLGLLEPDTSINVTGHSLGGHLADAFVKAFPTIGGNVTEGFTYNGLGVGPGLDNLLNDVADLYGITPDTTSGNSSFSVNNLIAEQGFDIVPNAFAASNQLGSSEFLFIEEGFGPDNHSISRLTDALAVYGLLTTIEPDLAVSEATRLLYAASNEAESSLENIVTNFGKLLNPSFDPENQLAEVKVPVYDRERLYTNLFAIQNSISQLSGHENLSITSLVNREATELKLKAEGEPLVLDNPEESIAYRYALVNLDPFVITGDLSIYEPHNQNNELELASFSSEYLSDRSAFLALKVELGIVDRVRKQEGSENLTYIDKASQLTLDVNRPAGAGQLPHKQIVFTSSENGEVALAEGNNQSDRLYGFLGNDTLVGEEGTDFLEGGKGDDSLFGNNNLDVLADDGDTDLLVGGDGFDTYYVGLNDIIDDSDGQGEIRIQGQVIALDNISLVTDSLSIFTNNDAANPVRFKQLPDGTLQVLGSYFTIRNFENDDFGIDLDANAPTPNLNLINGTVEDDVLTGTAPDSQTGATGNDEIHGLAGNDSVDGNGGNDVVFGEAGDDVLATGEGHDVLDGGAGRDVLRSGAGKDVLLGGNGENFLSAAEDDDYLEGGINSDYLAGGAGTDTLFGGEGDDVLWGDATLAPLDRNWSVTVTDALPGEPGGKSVSFDGTIFGGFVSMDERGDLLDGGPGDDILLGGGGNDQLYGGAGQDDMEGEAGDDRLEGGSGDDALFGDSSTDTGISGNDILLGGEGNDRIVGGPGDDEIEGGAGDDLIFGDLSPSTGAGGADHIDGGEGNDQIEGGADNDTLHGDTGHDTLLGGAGNDFIDGGEGNDVIAGGPGDDEIHAGDGNDTNVQGNEGNDLIHGDAGDDVLFGQDGDDQLYGGAGDDQLVGGDGHDILLGENGNDQLFGGAGNDTLDGGDSGDTLQGGDGNDALLGGNGVDFLFGEAGDDSLDGGIGDDILVGGSGNDSLMGGSGNDDLNGGDGIDILGGGAGNDDLEGGKDADLLFGEAGNDTLNGGRDNDTLHGGTGNDTLIGGFGDDVFRFEIGDGMDTIIEQGDSALDFLVLGAGLDTFNTFLNREGDDLTVTHNIGLNDSVIIRNWFLGPENKLNRIEFNDGAIWSQGFIDDNLNIAPVANTDILDVDEDTETTINASTLLANDTDPDGDTLTLAGVGEAVNGTVELNENGDIVFLSDPDFNGEAVFEYTVRDNRNGQATQTVTVNVLSVNDAPVGNSDDFIVDLREGLVPGDEIEISDTQAVDTFVSLAATRLSNGNIIAVWQGYDLDIEGVDVAFQIFDPIGNPLGEQQQANIASTNSNTFPSVAPLSNGGFVISWETIADSIDRREIAGQLFDADGKKAGAEFRVNTETEFDQTFSSITQLGDDGFFATWITFSDTSSTFFTLAGQRFDGAGNKIGNEVDLEIPIIQTLLDKNYDIAGFSNGGFAVAAGGIAYAFDSSGNQIGATGYSTLAGTPSVSVLSDDRFIVTWEESGFRGRLFNPDGSTSGSEFMIGSGEEDVSVTGLKDGGFIISWFDSTNNNSLTAQRYDADATPVGDRFIINNINDPGFDFSDLVGLDNGGFIAIWTEINDGGNASDNAVQARAFNLLDTSEGLTLTLDVLANDTDVDIGDTPDNFTLDSVVLQGTEGAVSIVNNQLQFDTDLDFAFLGAGEEKNFVADYIMSDSAGLSSASTATITIVGSNDAPEVAELIPDQIADEDAPFSFKVPENTFADPDNDDSLEFSATLSYDSPLPAWLQFDKSMQTFSGTPENTDVGTLDIKITATDNFGEFVSDGFSLTVNNTNDAPSANPDVGFLTLSELNEGREIFVGGEEFNINTTTVDDFEDFDSVRLVNGNSVVVWANANNEIAFRFFDKEGNATGAQLLTQTNPNTVRRLSPDVAALSNGNFVVTFNTSDASTGDNSGTGLAGQIFDENGNKVGSEFLINDQVDGNQGDSKTGALSNGGFVSTYQTMDFNVSASPLIKAQIFNQQGNRAGNEFIVSELDENSFRQQVAHFPGGGFIVAWSAGAGVARAQVFDNSGGKVGSGIQLDDANNPVVEALPDDTFVLAWNDSGSLKTRIFDISGLPAGEVNLIPGNLPSLSRITALVEGGYVVTYTDRESTAEGLSQELNMQELDSSGNLVGDKVNIDRLPAESTFVFSDSIIVETSNGILATWGLADGNILNFGNTDFQGRVFTVETESSGNEIFIDVLANDKDIDFDDSPANFTLDSVSLQGSKGQVSIADNELKFDSLDDFASLAEGETEDVVIDYTMSDNEGLSSSSTATITVAGINDAPIVLETPSDKIFNEGEMIDHSLPDNLFFDPDNGDHVEISSNLESGDDLPAWLVFNSSTLTFTGTPSLGDAGTFPIEVVATDTDNLSSSSVFELVINAEPVTNTDELTASNDKESIILASELTINDTDRDGDALTIVDVDNAVNATVGLDENNNVLFAPVSGFTGRATFDYVVSDSRGGRDTGQVSVHVFNSIDGDAGDNVLVGTQARDMFDGGAGDDTLIGGDGDDLYLFGRDDGNDTVIEDAATVTGGDVLRFNSDIAFADVEILSDKKDLVFTIKDTGDAVTLRDWVSKGSAYPVNVEFGDGTVLDLEDLDVRERVAHGGNPTVRGFRFNDRLYGDERDNRILAKDGDDILDGRSGNDILEGMSGDDTYQFIAGWGNDTIIENDLENDPAGGNTDTVAFGSGVTLPELMFHRNGEDLVVSHIGTADDVTIQDWFLGSEYQTEIFKTSEGSVLLNNQVDQLIQAMSAFSAETGLDWESAVQQQPEEVQTILAASWQ